MVSFMCAIVAGYSIALHFILKKKKKEYTWILGYK